jgi:hypothetical protein
VLVLALSSPCLLLLDEGTAVRPKPMPMLIPSPIIWFLMWVEAGGKERGIGGGDVREFVYECIIERFARENKKMKEDKV